MTKGQSMRMQPKPLWHYVLVLLTEETEASGIILPASVERTKPSRGVVVAKGPDAEHVEVGQVVLFFDESAREIEVEGEKHHLICEHGILMILDDAALEMNEGSRGTRASEDGA